MGRFPDSAAGMSRSSRSSHADCGRPLNGGRPRSHTVVMPTEWMKDLIR